MKWGPRSERAREMAAGDLFACRIVYKAAAADIINYYRGQTTRGAAELVRGASCRPASPRRLHSSAPGAGGGGGHTNELWRLRQLRRLRRPLPVGSRRAAAQRKPTFGPLRTAWPAARRAA